MLREFKEDTYIIIHKSDLSSVDFDQIKQNSVYTCRYSLDDTKVILSYKDTPNFISIGRLKPIKYLTWDQAVVEMDLDSWSQNPIDDE
ncbi:MAG: hypothetical protein Unbinned2903contig1001_30 [Prokaryotic dsDNA virus sp.]|nr:MAG: hypothetical protein Unbinned2903contig1001_30 [Prokaryotic dsDNA virus sp.]|tara:strand:+ start:6521 stop:6784 length:264 start_codon:yes stop_codon:yes gene_type:complete